MKKKFDLGVYSNASLKKIILELGIVFLIILFSVSNTFATPAYSEVSKVAPDKELSRKSQQQIVTGTVIEAATRETMQGVTVEIKGTSITTLTNEDGKYSLSVADRNATLVFSFVGYVTQEVPLNGSTSLNIVLVSKLTGLDEVVVVGYGTQKKENLTGAVSTINYEKILGGRPAQSAAKALEGVIPGLNVRSGDGGGQLNVVPDINIRGVGTIGAGSVSAPLVLIDGVPGDLNSINPQDIDNISVLKDAASASIYGTRGAFGVILVTTKSGKMGDNVRTVARYTSNMHIASPINMPQYASAWNASKFLDEAFRNSNQSFSWLPLSIRNGQKAFEEGKGPEWGPIDSQNPNFRPEYYGSNDWNSTLYKSNVPSYENNVNVSGGGKNYSFYVSGNNLDKSGLLRAGTENWNRKALTARLAAQIGKKVTVEYNGSFSWINYDAPTYLRYRFYYSNSRRYAHQPWKFPDGNFGHDIWGRSVGEYLENAGRTIEKRDLNQHIVNVTINPLKNWNIHISGSTSPENQTVSEAQLPVFNTYNDGTRYLSYIEGAAFGGNPGDTWIGNKYYKNEALTTNIYSDYFKQTDNGHYFKVMAGFNAEEYKNFGFGFAKSGLITPDVIALDAATSAGRNLFGNSKTWSTAGYFGRINYSYKEKYLLEVNSRYDGASRFIGDRRWGLFPSVSAGWNIAKEDFFGSLKNTVQLLKIRASYGSLGNMNTSNWYPFYLTLPMNLQSRYLVGGNYTITSSQPGIVSSTLTWEKVKTWNFGLDYSVFNNRLTGGFDIFRRSTLGMVGPPAPLPNTLGVNPPNVNNADMFSQGFELNLGWRDNFQIKNSPFNYSVNIILSDETQTVSRYNSAVQSINGWYNGKKMGEIWGYTTIDIARSKEQMDKHLASLPNGGQSAISSTWQEGDIMYKDLNGDGQINPGAQTLANHGDVSIIGNSSPRYN
ncbi:MAG: SusC/RagA family TonB-linked outer membrane protein, partial [Ginsengibacter sp.]